MATIDQRLHALERELYRSRQASRVLLLVVVAVGCIAGANGDRTDGSSPPKSAPSPGASSADSERLPNAEQERTVEAEKFVLLDPQGRTRVRIQVTDEGPAISMLDEEGQKRLELSQTPIASEIRIFGSSEPMVSLRLNHSDNAGRLEFHEEQGSTRMNAAGFSISDASSQPRLYLSLLNGNFPVLGMRRSGQQGPPSVELTASDSIQGLKIHDQDGHPLLSAIAADRGAAFLSVRHPHHERSLQISNGTATGGPELAFVSPASEDGSGGLLPRLRLYLDEHGQGRFRIVDGDGQPLAAPNPQ